MTEEEKRIVLERARIVLESLGFRVTRTEIMDDKIVIQAERKIQKKEE